MEGQASDDVGEAEVMVVELGTDGVLVATMMLDGP